MTIVSGNLDGAFHRPGLRAAEPLDGSRVHWDRWRAYDLLTHVGQISVGYYGIGTVAAKINSRYLA